MSDPVRLVVVGAGMMGALHARVARQLPSLDLVAVVDPDLERAGALCAAMGGEPLASLDHVSKLGVEAAVIATPTAMHVPAALQLIADGIHVLVEKPIAPTLESAEQMVSAAAAAGVVLAIGHIERFNAAAAELRHLLDDPIHVEASRIGGYSARVADGVILDLMIHDIDIVLSLVGDDVEAVEVSGVSRTVRSATEDLATATVRFSNGLTATFNTSRLGQQKIRTIEITQLESTVVADLVRRDVTIHRMSRQEYLAEDGARYRQSTVVETPFLDGNAEPLQLELNHFADCVRTGATPRVDGRAGMRALELAKRVSEAIAGK